jgi:hypothetical protein
MKVAWTRERLKMRRNLLGGKTFERTLDLFLTLNEDRLTDSREWILEEPLQHFPREIDSLGSVRY